MARVFYYYMKLRTFWINRYLWRTLFFAAKCILPQQLTRSENNFSVLTSVYSRTCIHNAIVHYHIFLLWHLQGMLSLLSAVLKTFAGKYGTFCSLYVREVEKLYLCWQCCIYIIMYLLPVHTTYGLTSSW